MKRPHFTHEKYLITKRKNNVSKIERETTKERENEIEIHGKMTCDCKMRVKVNEYAYRIYGKGID